jgi:hypothetical protein
LAATAATHFDSGTRPDFVILAYPVITFEPPYAHQGSRKNLLGAEPDPKLVGNLSNDTQVTAQTPPTFLFHTDGDKGVPAENSVLFYPALRKAGVPAELHIYERGPHGLGWLKDPGAGSSLASRGLADWLKLRGTYGFKLNLMVSSVVIGTGLLSTRSGWKTHFDTSSVRPARNSGSPLSTRGLFTDPSSAMVSCISTTPVTCSFCASTGYERLV